MEATGELLRGELRMCETVELASAASAARVRGFNRQMPMELRWALDPYGTHLVEPVMFHDHADGKRVPRHVRCRLYLKFPRVPEPVVMVADLQIEDVEAMSLAPKEAAHDS